VPLEASAMGLPIVATRVPGCVDAVMDERTGILVPPKNATELQQALGRYLGDPGLRARHGAAGRERVLREFRQEGIWEAIYETYVELIEKRGLRNIVPVRERESV
jgi:glycosyltransferase involved in cell wall biosynthesis